MSHALLKLTSILRLVYPGGQTYNRELSLPILQYDVAPPKTNAPHDDPPASTGMYMVTWLILCAPSACSWFFTKFFFIRISELIEQTPQLHRPPEYQDDLHRSPNGGNTLAFYLQQCADKGNISEHHVVLANGLLEDGSCLRSFDNHANAVPVSFCMVFLVRALLELPIIARRIIKDYFCSKNLCIESAIN